MKNFNDAFGRIKDLGFKQADNGDLDLDRKTNVEVQTALRLINVKKAIVVFVNMAVPEARMVEVHATEQYFEKHCSKALDIFFNSYYIAKITMKGITPFSVAEVNL